MSASVWLKSLVVGGVALLGACGGGSGGGGDSSPPAPTNPPPTTSPPPAVAIPTKLAVTAKPAQVVVPGVTCREFGRDEPCSVRATDITTTLHFTDSKNGTADASHLSNAIVRLSDWSHCAGMIPRPAYIDVPLPIRQSNGLAAARQTSTANWDVYWQAFLDYGRFSITASAPGGTISNWCKIEIEYGTDSSGKIVPVAVASTASSGSVPMTVRIYNVDGNGLQVE